MHRRHALAVAVLSLFAVTACGTTPPAPSAATDAAAADAKLSYSNKWRIEVSEGANSDGEIVFRVTPKGGTAQDVRVKIDDGRGEDGVARDIKNTFEKQLDTSKYDIEIDDGEDVLVKKDLTEPVFALVLVSSTVKSVRLRVEKE
ncbi:MAG: hypothetical protein EHM60_06910 [Lysobacterales bacterium]|jgi:hypothetical protein|nr:MAG: hypothetical protein EHM60_06910 [Xanthomonadales bacterium]